MLKHVFCFCYCFASIIQIDFINKLKFLRSVKRYARLSNALSGKRMFQTEEACLTFLEKSKEGKTEGAVTKRKGSYIGYWTLWGFVGHF